jgi:hypothetical protein
VPLPALSKAWILDVNNTVSNTGVALTTGKTLLLTLLADLIAMPGGSWVCYFSCKGVVGGVGTAGDGINRWVTSADVVLAAAGSNHSWFVLRNTSTGVQICFDMVVNNSTVNIALYMSVSAGFTGGTVTARPTATDELVFSASQAWGFTGTDVQHRYHLWQSSDGQCTRIVLAAQGAVTSFWMLGEKFNASVTGFSSPYYITIYSGATPTFAALYSLGKFRFGSVTSNSEMLIEGNTTTPGNNNATYGTVPNSVDSTWTFWPVGLAGTTALSVGRMGSFYDLWFGSTAVATGDRYPLDTDIPPGQFIQIGGVILRWLDNTTALGLT